MTIPRIVIDSNVVISGVFFGGKPQRVLEYITEKRAECFISMQIIDEIRDVVQRPTFGFSSAQALLLVEELTAICTLIAPTISIQEIVSDPDDNIVLECAYTANAQYIISGDSHLRQLEKWNDIVICSPSEFLNII